MDQPQTDAFPTLDTLPNLKVKAGPKDPPEQWKERLKEEYQVLIAYIKSNKEADSDWFKMTSSPDGLKQMKTYTRWEGTCWSIYNHKKYQFQFQFQIPAAYPLTPIEIKIPALINKTQKIYRDGKICTDVHFAPLWGKVAPKFGIAHAMAGGLAPWLAAQVPYFVENKIIE